MTPEAQVQFCGTACILILPDGTAKYMPDQSAAFIAAQQINQYIKEENSKKS